MTEKSNFSQWYHEILENAEVIDQRYPVQGMLVYRRWGLSIIRAMQNELEGMLEASGHEPILMPVLIPEDVLGKETKHIAGFEEEVFWVTHAGKNELERKLSLRPTSETSIYEMFSLWIRAHTDLPLKVHQSCAVYRYETKHTRPLMRGREFLWNEGHSAHVDAVDTEKNIADIKEIYARLISGLLCLPFNLSIRPEWDRFPGAVYTCAFDTIMPDGKTLQIATVHNLGQTFSKVFGIKFEDEKGRHEHVFQASYGPSFGRLLAAAISIHGDDKGLVLPPRIAPVQAVIVPIIFKESEGIVMAFAERVADKLRGMGIRVYTDAGDGRPGAKFYRWEMKGVPLRIEIGPRDVEKNAVMAVRRDTGEKQSLSFDKIDDVRGIFTEIENNIRKSAKEKFDAMAGSVKGLEELKSNAGYGIISVGWCGGKSCAEKIEEFADILSVEEKQGVCPVCGKKGNSVKVGKSY